MSFKAVFEIIERETSQSNASWRICFEHQKLYSDAFHWTKF